MTDATPLIVCGMGRSGTRNTANVLNVHDHVQLYGELPVAVARSLFELLTMLDNTYSKKGYHADLWSEKKASFIFDSFDHLGKAPRAGTDSGDRVQYVGHKTPHHEHLFDEYERHFGSVGLEPVYFYCARDVRSCWRSYKSMPWSNRTLESFLEEYKESYKQLSVMEARAGGRVLVVPLNGLLAADDKIAWYTETLFQPLGLELSQAAVARIDAIQNNNAAVKVTGRPPVELAADELRVIEADPEIEEIQARHFGPVVA